MKKMYKVEGMHCASCASMIELDLEDAGIKGSCSYANASLEIDGPHNREKVAGIVKKSGYIIK